MIKTLVLTCGIKKLYGTVNYYDNYEKQFKDVMAQNSIDDSDYPREAIMEYDDGTLFGEDII